MEHVTEGATPIGIYTDEQKQYVASVKDEDLRDHLLHQVRLRDNMESDRNSFERMLHKAQLKDKLIIDLADMRNDNSEGSYYYTWQANIAMAFYDEYRREMGDSPKMNVFIHEIANNAAKNFLNLLIK